MFSLYEIVKWMTVRDEDSKDHSILNYAWREAGEVNFLALVVSTGDVILRYYCSGHSPVVHHIPWTSEKPISCLCFDPTVSWLLVVTEDLTVCIVPVLSLVDNTAKVDRKWNLEDVTVLRFRKQSGIPSVVTWWHTLDDRQIAIIGMKNGTIQLVDLMTRRSVHQLSLETRINKLELIQDDQQMSTYLMISSQPLGQWKLMLECRIQDLASPMEREARDMGYDSLSSSPILSITQITEETRSMFQPQLLSQFPRSVMLQPQFAKGRHFITSHCSKESTFQIYDSNIERSPLFVYRLPTGSDTVLYSDKVLLAMTRLASGKKFYVLANQKAETSTDQIQEFNKDSILQQFDIPQNEHILTVQKKSFPFYWHEKCEEKLRQRLHQDKQLGLTSSGSYQLGMAMSHGIELTNHTVLDGCVIITDASVYEIRPRISPERLFLELTFYNESVHIENLGIGLGLDINSLYEKSAEHLLQRGQVVQAIKFCKFVKSTPGKLVTYLAKYGYVSDAITHIKQAMSCKDSNIDKKQLCNLYIYCMVYLLMEEGKAEGQQSLVDFLVRDFHYEEQLAIELLAEHNLISILLDVAMARGLVLEALEILVQKGNLVLEPVHINKLIDKGFAHHLVKASNGVLLDGLTPNSLVRLFSKKPTLAYYNYTKLLRCLDEIDTSLLETLCELYDPSQSQLGYHIGRQLYTKKRRGSISSLTSTSSDGDNISEIDTFPDVAELVGFFFLLVLHLNMRFDSPTVEDFTIVKLKEIKRKPVQKKTRKRKLKYQSNPVSSGAQHVAVVRNGDLYTWGRASHGRLGHGDLVPENPVLGPCRVDTLNQLQIKVISVSCGAEHTIALTQQGIYGWGSSMYGQVGVGTRHMYSRPMLINLGQSCVSVTCGLHHTLALTQDSQVYSWGWGVHGQLGHGSPEDCLTPTKIQTLSDKGITSLAAGYCHTMALNNQGELWVFGCGYFGQLGIGQTSKQSLPVKMDKIPHKIHLIATKYFHNVAVTVHNVVYTWGVHPYNLRLNAHAVRKARQTGTTINDPVEKYLQPERVDTSFVHGRIVKATCGKSHTCLVTLDGDVYTWGRNMDGQLGNNSRQDVKNPSMVTSINDHQVMYIAAGGEFNIAMDSDYTLWVWGKNEFGQLGLDQSEPQRRIRPNSNFKEHLVPTCCKALPRLQHQHRHLALSRSRSTSSEEDVVLSEEDDFVPHIPDLQSETGVKYSRTVLLSVLEHLPDVCNCLKLLRIYVDNKDWLSAAYVCLHQQNFPQALSFHLTALSHYKPSLEDKFSQIAVMVINKYTRLCIEQTSSASEKEEVNRMLLSQILKFWEKHSLPILELEIILGENINNFACTLCTILFWTKSEESDLEISNKFRNSFSTTFKFKILQTVIQTISDNDFERRHPALNQTLCILTGQQSVTSLSNLNPFSHLWQDVVQNLQKDTTKYIYVSRSELDHLNENLHSSRRTDSSEPNSVLFTCGHNYTRQSFVEEVLGKFEREVTHGHTKLEKSGSILVQYYQRPGMLCVACPKCVLNALNQ